jgi:hypothetical protein
MFSISIVGVRVQVLDSFFQNSLYTALQNRSPSEFYASLKVFGVIAGVNIVQVVAEYFMGHFLIIRWRVWLNDQLVTDWLRGKACHNSDFLADRVDNPDQRIQEDVDSFISASQTHPVGGVYGQVAGGLGGPGAGWVCGDSGEVGAAGAVLDCGHGVEAAQGDGVDVEGVDREDGLGLAGQELLLGRA